MIPIRLQEEWDARGMRRRGVDFTVADHEGGGLGCSETVDHFHERAWIGLAERHGVAGQDPRKEPVELEALENHAREASWFIGAYRQCQAGRLQPAQCLGHTCESEGEGSRLL